jgi:transcription termination factor 2
MEFKPFKHQIDAQNILHLMEEKGNGGFLADAMGLGKTLTMAMFMKHNKIPKTTDLIIAPYSVLRTWKREIERIKDYPMAGHSPSILIYHGRKRVAELASQNWNYVITTYAILGTGELNSRQWCRVVLDESHTIKNGLRKKAPKCAVAAYEISKRSQFRYCVSGTPFNNRMLDIAAQCKFIGTAPYNDPKWWKTYDKNQEAIDLWRKRFVLRRTKEGMLEKPIYHDISVSPTATEETLINNLRAKAAEEFAKWRRATGSNKVQIQAKILGLITRLRITSNSFYTGEVIVDTEKVLRDNAKVERLVNDLDDMVINDPNNGVVVFSQFTSFFKVLEQVIEETLPGVEVMKFTGELNDQERDDVVNDFNESRHPRIILVSLMAGGVGLSLHHGSSTVALVESYYNPFMEQQAEERVHRLGQKHQVNVYRYSMDNSVETWIQGLKQKKLFLASNIALGKKGEIGTNFSFDDIKDLFSDHVAFNGPEDTKINEEEGTTGDNKETLDKKKQKRRVNKRKIEKVLKSCVYSFVKGKKKGEACGKKTVNEMCSKHSKMVARKKKR